MSPQTRESLRSMLFVPATRPDRARKLPATGTDAGVIDLEDAVAPEAKERARADVAVAAAALATSDFALYVRVNPTNSPWYEGDVAAVPVSVRGVLLPKAESAEEVTALRADLDRHGRAHVAIVAGIETARGVQRVASIADGGLVSAMYFGAEDFITDLGGVRTPAGNEVLYARSQVVLAARVAAIPAIDQAVVDLIDADAFVRDAQTGRELGYGGKLCIHPDQVALANRVFSPSEEELAAARRILAAVEEAGDDRGVVRVDGLMIDAPLIERARRTLVAAERPADRAAGGS